MSLQLVEATSNNYATSKYALPGAPLSISSAILPGLTELDSLGAGRNLPSSSLYLSPLKSLITNRTRFLVLVSSPFPIALTSNSLLVSDLGDTIVDSPTRGRKIPPFPGPWVSQAVSRTSTSRRVSSTISSMLMSILATPNGSSYVAAIPSIPYLHLSAVDQINQNECM